MYESLHNHTTDSDGTLSHLETLAVAERLGLGVMAFTDHDRLPSQATLEQLKIYTGPVKWLLGVELSVIAPADAGDDQGHLHLLGLFTDPTNAELLARCQQIEQSRLQRMRAYLEHFHSLGFVVTEADILAQAPGGNVGSPHMVKAINQHPENQVIIDRLLQEFLKAADRDPGLAALRADLEAGGPKQIPYTLFMRKVSFKPAPETAADAIDADAGVKLIRGAGGLALLAHWYFDKTKLSLAYLEKMLAERRLDGVGTHIINQVNDYDTAPESKLLEDLAIRYGAATVIGSDAHNAGDLEAFTRSERARLSIGQTARLLKQFQPDLSWTNFNA